MSKSNLSFDIGDNSIYGDIFCDIYCDEHASECKCTNTVKQKIADITGSNKESFVVTLILEYCDLVYVKKNMMQ